MAAARCSGEPCVFSRSGGAGGAVSGSGSSTVRRGTARSGAGVAPAPDPFVRAAGKRVQSSSLQTLGDEKTCGERQRTGPLVVGQWWAKRPGTASRSHAGLAHGRGRKPCSQARLRVERRHPSFPLARLWCRRGHRFDPGTLHSEKLCKRALSVFRLGGSRRAGQRFGQRFRRETRHGSGEACVIDSSMPAT